MVSNTDMKDRILAFMKAEGLSSGILADKIKVQRSSISHILSERNKPSYDFILKFLEAFPNVNAEWFITGRGGMYKAPVQKDLFAHDTEHYKTEKVVVSTEKEQDMAEKEAEELKKEKIKASMPSEVTSGMTVKRKIKKIIVLYDNGVFEEYRIAD